MKLPSQREIRRRFFELRKNAINYALHRPSNFGFNSAKEMDNLAKAITPDIKLVKYLGEYYVLAKDGPHFCLRSLKDLDKLEIQS